MASLVEMTMELTLMVGFAKNAGKLKKLEPALMVTSPSYSVPRVMEETKKYVAEEWFFRIRRKPTNSPKREMSAPAAAAISSVGTRPQPLLAERK